MVSYGNIQPEVEVDADTYEEAFAIAEGHIRRVWNKYVEEGKQLPDDNRVKLEAFVGGEVYYDKLAHVYTNEAGEVYLSGSTYAESFRKPFDKQGIAEAMAKKIGVDPSTIIDMWELKSQVSREFGTVIHKGLQLYEQYGELATKLGKTTNIHDHPVINNAIKSFYDAHKGEKAISEVLVVDHEAKHAGQIDRLLLTGDKKCRIQDFKTNVDIMKDLPILWKQLEFYRDIMKSAGWGVEGMDIFHFNGTWKEYVYELGASKPSTSVTTKMVNTRDTA